MELKFEKSICTGNYIRYECFTKITQLISNNFVPYMCGYIVLEKYDDRWNLELMHVTIQRKGIGKKFLTYVLENENLIANNVTVCPITSISRKFFAGMGLLISI